MRRSRLTVSANGHMNGGATGRDSGCRVEVQGRNAVNSGPIDIHNRARELDGLGTSDSGGQSFIRPSFLSKSRRRYGR